MVNVFITGITGFIGPFIAKKFIHEGYNVYGLIRHSPYRNLDALTPILKKLHLIEGDIRDFHSVNSAIRASKPDIVIHAAALTPVRLSFVDPFQYIHVNYEGTANVVHAIIENTPKARMILASTGEVYGFNPNKKAIKEDAQLNPTMPYAVSKMAADHYVQMAMKLYDLKATILRFFNTYGRREKGFFTEYVIAAMLNGETVYVGLPNATRDYMYIDDHIQAYTLAIENESSIGEVYNVSAGNPNSNREYVKTISELVGFKGKIVYGEYPPGYPPRPAIMDPIYIVGDSNKIREKLGWKPSVTLNEGLKKTINMFIKAKQYPNLKWIW